MTIKKGDSDRENRLRYAMGYSKTPEEARLKRCSHFTLDLDVADADNAAAIKSQTADAGATCQLILDQRERQLAECIDELTRTLQDATDMHRHAVVHGLFDDVPKRQETRKRLPCVVEARRMWADRCREFLRFCDADTVGDSEAAAKLQTIIDSCELYDKEIFPGERDESLMSAEARAFAEKTEYTEEAKNVAVHGASRSD